MAFDDRTLMCAGCGRLFVHTAGDQGHADRGGFAAEPVRCPDCRRAGRGPARGALDDRRRRAATPRRSRPAGDQPQGEPS